MLSKILAKLNEILEAIKQAFKASVADTDTPVAKPVQKPAVEAPVKPERDPMHPLSVLGLPVGAADGSANPTQRPFRGDPQHPMYKQGDGWKIMLVSYALTDGKKWDQYLLDRGMHWDLEVPPDHPSIGFKIPK